MQDVLQTSCQSRSGAQRSGGFRAWVRPPAYVVHSVAAVFVSAVVLHLLLELAGLVHEADAGSLLAIAGGMAAVLITMAPFAVAFAVRAHRAWTGDPDRSNPGSR